MQQGTVYLLHFATPFKHARHYVGYTTDLEQRIEEHRTGRGARLLAVVRGWDLLCPGSHVAASGSALRATPPSCEEHAEVLSDLRRQEGVAISPEEHSERYFVSVV